MNHRIYNIDKITVYYLLNHSSQINKTNITIRVKENWSKNPEVSEPELPSEPESPLSAVATQSAETSDVDIAQAVQSYIQDPVHSPQSAIHAMHAEVASSYEYPDAQPSHTAISLLQLSQFVNVQGAQTVPLTP